jgi:hypothetical protein
VNIKLGFLINISRYHKIITAFFTYLKHIKSRGLALLNPYIVVYLPENSRKLISSFLSGLLLSIFIAACFTPSGISAITYKTSWIGNSFGGDNKWVQIRVSGMYVTPDGTVYANTGWDEAGREVGFYRDGKVVGKAEDLHGWGRSGGVAITADAKYIYLAMQHDRVGNAPKDEDYPPDKINWHCVRRYDLSGKAAPFPGGRGYDKSMLIVSQKNEVTGIAVTNSEMYVSEGGANKVHVYDKNTMKLLRSFAVPNPQEIAIDKKAELWVAQGKKGATPGKVLHYSKDGKQLSGTINEALEPSAIAFDNQGRLLVADNSQRQQVLIYNISSKPNLVGTLGVKGGIFSGIPGEVGDLKFAGITGVGSDRNGNIYVANDGFNNSGTDIRKFSSTGKMQWRLLGLHFLDNADVDPSSDGSSVFTKEERFVMDYSKPAGQQWKYQGYTLNPFKYPQDPRLTRPYDATIMRRIQGKPLMFLTDMYGGSLLAYRFNKATDGEIAIPSAWFVGSRGDNKPTIDGNYPPHQPVPGEWIWRDSNGNGAFDANEYDRSQDHPYIGGWWVDSKGDIWKALRTQDGVGIRRYRFGGFDRYGNPIYSYKAMEKQKHPSMFTDLRRIEYFPETDTMYLSGFTKETPAINQDYSKLMGSEIARFDNWSKGNRKPSWRIVLPTDSSAPPEVLPPAAMSVAGDYVFVTTVKTWEVYVYETKTGKLVQKLKPGTEVSGELGWVDIAYGVRAFRRSNGEYLVFVEEDFKGKVIMYQLKK